MIYIYIIMYGLESFSCGLGDLDVPLSNIQPRIIKVVNLSPTTCDRRLYYIGNFGIVGYTFLNGIAFLLDQVEILTPTFG